MVSILEVYSLKCNACGKPKKVSRLHVYGNLSEIERTWVCPDCERQGAHPAPDSTGDEAGADAAGA